MVDRWDARGAGPQRRRPCWSTPPRSAWPASRRSTSRWQSLPASAVVTDIVYVPLRDAAPGGGRQRGLPTADGLGMLLHQGRCGSETSYGVKVDVSAEQRRAVAADLGDLTMEPVPPEGFKPLFRTSPFLDQQRAVLLFARCRRHVRGRPAHPARARQRPRRRPWRPADDAVRHRARAIARRRSADAARRC